MIGRLFTEGQSVFQYPYKLVYLYVTEDNDNKEIFAFRQTFPIKIAVTVSKKRFKSAVKRNLIKRRTKEAYRLQQPWFKESLFPMEKQYAAMFIYIGKEIEPYEVIEKNMKSILHKFVKEIENSNG